MGNLFFEYFGRFSGADNLAFLSLVGAVGVIVGGIPAMMLQKPVGSSSGRHFLTRFAAFVYGMLGILSAAFILTPLFSKNSGLMIIIGLFFAAMFLFKSAISFPNTPIKAWALVLSPFLFSVIAYFISGSQSLVIKLRFFSADIFFQLLNSGMIIFAGFWLSWPFIFFALNENSVSEFKNNLKNHTILTLIGLSFIALIWFGGLYYSYQAAANFLFLAGRWSYTLPLLLGLIVQVVNEARSGVKSYKPANLAK